MDVGLKRVDSNDNQSKLEALTIDPRELRAASTINNLFSHSSSSSAEGEPPTLDPRKIESTPLPTNITLVFVEKFK